MGYVPLIFVTFLYISLFVYIIANTQIENLREDWNSKRCYPMGMLLASRIPDPNDTTVNRSKFSSDNFQFCIQKLVDESMAVVMMPIMSILSMQVGIAGSTNQSANTLRDSAASGVTNPFNTLMNFAWKKFGYILSNLFRIFYKLNSAFDRIFGITLASVFAGISLFKTIKNSINFIVKVVIIILVIIIALLFLIFIPIAPIIPVLIIPAIIAVAATDSGDKVGGMQGSLNNCVETGTLVKCKEGWRKVEDLLPGDKLFEGTILGILRGKGSSSVSIHSVIISDYHILFDVTKGKWVFAKDHSDAIPCDTPAFVYSLVTSSKIWKVKGDNELTLRDWTHLKDGDEDLYEEKICSILGSATAVTASATAGFGLIGPDSLVWKRGVGLVPVHSVRIGDMITDGETMTRVTSVYNSSERGNASGPNEFVRVYTSKGWAFLNAVNTVNAANAVKNQKPLMHLGTESGTFTLNGLMIRDVNEIGHEYFIELEEFLLSLLYK